MRLHVATHKTGRLGLQRRPKRKKNSMSLSPKQYAEVVQSISSEPLPHLESLEESLAHAAIKRLYQEVGDGNTYRMSAIRISKVSTTEGPSMIATGSIRVYFVGRSTTNDIHPV